MSTVKYLTWRSVTSFCNACITLFEAVQILEGWKPDSCDMSNPYAHYSHYILSREAVNIHVGYNYFQMDIMHGYHGSWVFMHMHIVYVKPNFKPPKVTACNTTGVVAYAKWSDYQS